METIYLTKMSSGNRASPEGERIVVERHTGSEIISRAEEVIAKEVGQDLAAYAGLEEAATRGKVGEDTVWGYVDKFGNKVDFNEEMKLRAAISVLRLNGHSFEATPIK
jgi:hypothetical protein